MLFKLSIRNMRKSIKDYMIYFMTLVFGVAVFYVFNSLDSQQAMMVLNSDSRDIVQLIVEMVGIVSVFVSVILGFLVIFANNFLIKRRKKEFGVYMTLGMGKRDISFIILVETILIGILSLIIGLIFGIFASQLTSVIVAKMFNADMTQYQFVFSSAAMLKTVLYFGIIFVVVMLFNVISVGRYQLIDLLTAQRKNESIKTKNLGLCVILFILSTLMLGYAYYQVTQVFNGSQIELLGQMILIGCIGTFLFFYSLSGFILRVVQSSKSHYLKGLNCFVLRQMNSTINTTVVSISIICLLQFFTICILSTAFSVNESLNKDLKQLTPVDLSIFAYGKEEGEDVIFNNLTEIDVTKEDFSDYIMAPTYVTPELTWGTTFKPILDTITSTLAYFPTQSDEEVMKVSDYNKIAEKFGNETITLADNQYAFVADYDKMMEFRNQVLKMGTPLTFLGQSLMPKYDHCIEGFIYNSVSHTNNGIIIVPDQYVEGMNLWGVYFNGNYAGDKETVKAIDTRVNDYESPDLTYNVLSRTGIIQSASGVTALFIFIGFYLGIIFLISGAAILALKQLSESSDNVDRYRILRKIGASDKMINRSLFSQIGIFFGMPLVLACFHSVFGIQVANKILAIFNKSNMLVPICITAGFIILIYGSYFLMTYLGSRSIIRGEINN